MKSKMKIFFTKQASVFIFLTTMAVNAQSWQTMASLPESIAPYSVAVNGKIYAIRGNDFYRASLSEPSSMYEYDTSTNVWTKKNQMTTKRSLFGMIELKGKIYALGGISNNTYANCLTMSDVEAYDIASGVWQTKSRMPKALYVMGVVIVQEKIYVLGGVCKQMINGVHVDSTSNCLYEYNPENDTWTTKARMSKHRAWSDAVAVNNKIYAIGGNNGIPLSGENTIEEYDVATNVWTEKTTFTNGFDGQCQSVVIKGKIYTLSSDVISTGAFTKALIGEYDPVTGTWEEKTQMLYPIMDFGKVVCNDQVYMIGGHLVSGMTMSDKVIKYNPATNSQVCLPNISQWFNSVAESGGIIYAVGGTNSSGIFTNRVVKYDTKNDPISAVESNSMPEKYTLLQNYPNPFNPSTIISYQLPVSSNVQLKIYDSLGRETVTLVHEFQNAGNHNIQFTTGNLQLTSGVYFYRLHAGNFVSTKKMILTK